MDNQNEKVTEITSEDAKLTKDGEEYIPSQPNVLNILQSSAPPGFTIQQHGQSEVITGPDGRRFIAQIYEQTPAGTAHVGSALDDITINPQSEAVCDSSNTSSTDLGSDSESVDTEEESETVPTRNSTSVNQVNVTQQQTDQDGNMARTLCVNLLSELVKGSYQLFKTRGKHLEGSAKQEAIHKLNVIKQKCDDMKESLSHEHGEGNSASSSVEGTPTVRSEGSEKSEGNSSENNCQVSNRPEKSDDLEKNKCVISESQDNKLEENVSTNKSEGNDSDSEANQMDSEEQLLDDKIASVQRKKRKVVIDEKCESTSESTSSSSSFKKAKYSWQIKGARNSAEKVSKSKVDLVCEASCSNEPSNSKSKQSVCEASCANEPSNSSSKQSASTEEETTKDSIKCVPSNVDCRKKDSISRVKVSSAKELESSSVKEIESRPSKPKVNQQAKSSGDVIEESRIISDASLPLRDSISSGQAPFTYLERWQNHHIAKAIVDNAINKTLDEMNLGPQDGNGSSTNQQQSTGSTFSRQRQRIEDAGVSQVILQRGLRRPSGVAPRPHRAEHQPLLPNTGTINPFINHLTEMTENMFVENLSAGMRLSARIDLGGNIQFNTHPSQSASNVPNTDSANNTSITEIKNDNLINPQVGQHDEVSNDGKTEEFQAKSLETPDTASNANILPPKTSLFSTSALCSKIHSCSSETISEIDKIKLKETKCNTQTKVEKPIDTNINSNISSGNSQSSSKCNNLSNSDVIGNSGLIIDNKEYEPRDHDTVGEHDSDSELYNSANMSALDVIEEIEKNAPSQNYLLDTAVNAVIYERGLQF